MMKLLPLVVAASVVCADEYDHRYKEGDRVDLWVNKVSPCCGHFACMRRGVPMGAEAGLGGEGGRMREIHAIVNIDFNCVFVSYCRSVPTPIRKRPTSTTFSLTVPPTLVIILTIKMVASIYSRGIVLESA
jgi:hypothetical protein